MSRSERLKLAYDTSVPCGGGECTLAPVVFLHGMTSSRKTWLDMPQKIADATKRTVYSLDARNHGESGWHDEFDYFTMAIDVENFMEDMNVSTAVLVGHSMGGKTGMALALSKPDKVEKLVVEDISPKRLPPSDRRFPLKYLTLMRESLGHVPEGCDLEKAKEIILEYIDSHTPKEQRDRVPAEYRSKSLPLKMTETGIAWQANVDGIERSFTNPKFRKEFEGLYPGEVLFIYGTVSPYRVYEGKDAILGIFPKAVFSAFEGASHSVHLEFPEEFCEKVIEFIGKK